MNALYNEIDPYAAQWLRNLVGAGHIADGAIDERSVRNLRPDDVRDAVQFHAFAGIGVWSYALRLAGWPDDLPVWTGSCPFQPFSAAGRRGGFADDRHLWPAWFALIRECRPAIVFGEQVASPDGLAWLDVVSTDLENEGYAFGAADLCAAGVGAPHIRQRLFFVAISDVQRREGFGVQLRKRESRLPMPEARGSGETGALVDADREQRERGEEVRREARDRPEFGGDPCIVGNASGEGSGRDTGAISRAEAPGAGEWGGTRRIVDVPESSGATGGFWSPAEWILCRDGKARPVESGSFPLVDVAPQRVGRLRAYGNAIVAQVAATFIRGAIERI